MSESGPPYLHARYQIVSIDWNVPLDSNTKLARNGNLSQTVTTSLDPQSYYRDLSVAVLAVQQKLNDELTRWKEHVGDAERFKEGAGQAGDKLPSSTRHATGGDEVSDDQSGDEETL
ncbi:hypothetical protein BD324DRAFT_623233 [Kockovaella imperatae]|uniref:EKC/KEOPS complex subunit GON7 n=1 Tax=Kockovaella imperatae TaxID=4999 RepID=A0A1Y1UI86_9TREE|nr:hypothetical protein BD324DRAFT_623233 [Kockovaella imperatae]ORX37761.1 hypothetical protein BD324DRAFT_623233 [Kockovaella imperatae]